jgi:hypothetical protein
MPVMSGFSQSLKVEDPYLKQVPPGQTPKIFPLAVNKGFFAAERIAISPDGRDIYFSEIKSYYPINGESIKRYRFSDGRWTGPFNMVVGGYAPALSSTGDTLFFEMKDIQNFSEAYFTVRKGQEWGKPERIMKSFVKAHYPQVSRHGNYFISTTSGNGLGLNDWCRVLINKTDTIAESLGKPLNTSYDNLDFYISRDESYIIITTPFGLAVSFSKDGGWTSPVSLGKKINFGLGMWGQCVTDDNKYMFYSTGTKPDYSDVSVYWVRIDGIIDSIRSKIVSH